MSLKRPNVILAKRNAKDYMIGLELHKKEAGSSIKKVLMTNHINSNTRVSLEKALRHIEAIRL